MHIAYFSKFPGSLIQLSRKIFHLWTLTNQDKKDNWHFMAFKSWFGDIFFKHDTVERPYHIIQYICDNIHRTTYRYIISQLVKLQVVISVTSNVFSRFIVLSGLMMDSASSLSRSSCKFFSVSNEYSWKRNHLIMHHYVKYKNERNIIHVAYKE
jgi:hypothetical protein